MKIKTLLIFIFIGYSLYLNSQVFNNRYIIDQTAVIFRQIVQTEDTIITMGLGSTFYAPYPGKLMFTKLNQEGEVLSYDLVMGDSLTHYFPLSSSSLDRKILAVGGAGGSFANESGFYALYDLDNGLEWIKQYYPPSGMQFFFRNCLYLEDRIYLLAGQNDPGIGGFFTKLICTDLLGDILWEKDFDDNNFSFTPSVITLNQDSNLYIGMVKVDEPFNQSIGNIKSLIYELDLDGNIIAEWLNDENKTYEPEQIIEVSDSSLLFVGRYFTGYNDNNSLLWQGYICKVDSLNNKDWVLKTGKPTVRTDMNNLIVAMDGNYIAIGVTFDSLSSSQVATESGHIIKFNIDGDMLWERRHYAIATGSEYNKLYDIVELADSSLLLCGQSVDLLGDFPQQGWLLKLDKHGCLVPGCHLDTSTENPLSIIQATVKIYPNPTRDYLNVYYKSKREKREGIFRLVDMQGTVILSFIATQNDTTYMIDLEKYSSGIYFLQYLENGQLSQTEKIIIQK
ncbi:MAG: T9SS type A sorting domain-containing protein [Saprospiraceae bacterium]